MDDDIVLVHPLDLAPADNSTKKDYARKYHLVDPPFNDDLRHEERRAEVLKYLCKTPRLSEPQKWAEALSKRVFHEMKVDPQWRSSHTCPMCMDPRPSILLFCSCKFRAYHLSCMRTWHITQGRDELIKFLIVAAAGADMKPFLETAMSHIKRTLKRPRPSQPPPCTPSSSSSSSSHSRSSNLLLFADVIVEFRPEMRTTPPPDAVLAALGLLVVPVSPTLTMLLHDHLLCLLDLLSQILSRMPYTKLGAPQVASHSGLKAVYEVFGSDVVAFPQPPALREPPPIPHTHCLRTRPTPPSDLLAPLEVTRLAFPRTSASCAWDSPSHSPLSSASSYNEIEHKEGNTRSVVRFKDVDNTSAARRATIYQSRDSTGGGYDGERPVQGVTILTSYYDEFAPSPTSGAVADTSLGGVALGVAAGMVGASMGVVAAPPIPAPPADSEAANAGSGTLINGEKMDADGHKIKQERMQTNPNSASSRTTHRTSFPSRRPSSSHQSLNLDAETRIQVLARLADLPGVEKDQCGAFIRTPPSLVLWAPQVESLIPLAAEFEEKLLKYIWRARGAASPSVGAPVRDSLAAPGQLGSLLGGAVSTTSGAWSEVGASGIEEVGEGEVSTTFLAPREAQTTTKERDNFNDIARAPATAAPSKKPTTLFGWSWHLQPRVASPTSTPDAEKAADAESGATGGGEGGKERKLVLLGQLYAGCGAALAAYFCLSGLSVLLEEYALDHDPTRFALLVTFPVIFCVLIVSVHSSSFRTFDPISSFPSVSSHSRITPPLTAHPVLLSPARRQSVPHHRARRAVLPKLSFYSAVKPAPNPAVDNVLPHITIQCPVYKESLKETIAPSVLSVKKAMQRYARQGGTSAIFICNDGMQLIWEEDRQAFYANHNIGYIVPASHIALSTNRAADRPRAPDTAETAIAGASIAPGRATGRVCALARSSSSSTRTRSSPRFRDAAREMHESLDLVIIQLESDVMQAAHHYFENGITHFTRRINKCISYGCANGEVAPFVGHNAFLRWSAVQDAAFDDPDDGKRKQWSESNVSEDFDLALRLLLGGYTLRWATYSEDGFKVGVNLTVQDELARWQKHAMGVTKSSSIHSSDGRGIGMMSYMFSYSQWLFHLIKPALTAPWIESPPPPLGPSSTISYSGSLRSSTASTSRSSSPRLIPFFRDIVAQCVPVLREGVKGEQLEFYLSPKSNRSARVATETFNVLRGLLTCISTIMPPQKGRCWGCGVWAGVSEAAYSLHRSSAAIPKAGGRLGAISSQLGTPSSGEKEPKKEAKPAAGGSSSGKKDARGHGTAQEDEV
ncbi:glycosyl transferase family group 2-domain-containing protein [Mycena metata]|uniref:Glycosyl transferase family group 2-domain-containing protein n=1 Tax=Mycena metata TaxID=1033252 RepID=A0AAD7I492_9AGAR|nr:glycosyl transferase family group 2-domain-containing protein [Mycena metata]